MSWMYRLILILLKNSGICPIWHIHLKLPVGPLIANGPQPDLHSLWIGYILFVLLLFTFVTRRLWADVVRHVGLLLGWDIRGIKSSVAIACQVFTLTR